LKLAVNQSEMSSQMSQQSLGKEHPLPESHFQKEVSDFEKTLANSNQSKLREQVLDDDEDPTLKHQDTP
jgi:hypothetical protein